MRGEGRVLAGTRSCLENTNPDQATSDLSSVRRFVEAWLSPSRSVASRVVHVSLWSRAGRHVMATRRRNRGISSRQTRDLAKEFRTGTVRIDHLLRLPALVHNLKITGSNRTPEDKLYKNIKNFGQ